MARMVPDRPATTSSAAEVAVFERIRDELTAEWIALHSVGMTIHDSKPWAEIDFVLIGPPGVFCLEVKGGVIAREGGVWYTTPQHGANAGRRQPLKESPFQQVASASAQLFHFLETRSSRFTNSITGYAVATPDVAWTVDGPDIDTELVYDQADTVRPFDAFMKRVVRRWTEKVGSNWNKGLESLSRTDKHLLLEDIRGDFRLVPSLRATADLAGKELIRLTEEQFLLFGRLAANPRVLAIGGAGTGKTVIAVEEARRLARDGKRVLYTCFSRNLAAHVTMLLSSEPRVVVRTLHGQMMDLVSAAGRQSQLPDTSEEDLLSLFLPELALEIILDSADVPTFDTIILDEGQDLLRENYLDVVEGLVGGDLRTGNWRIFLDPNQNIFRGIAASGLSRVRDARPAEWALTVNCRNTAPIATQVALLSGVPLAEVLSPDGPDVQVHWYATVEDQGRAIQEVFQDLKGEGFESERIVILSRHRIEAAAVHHTALRTIDVSQGRNGPRSWEARFSTVASFKGLEADVVLLTDVDDLSSTEGLTSVYVGASRARVALHVFIASSQKARFRDLAKEFGRNLLPPGP